GGYLNGSNKDDLYLKGRIALENLDIDEVFFKFDNFGQDYLVSNQVHGRIDGTIDVKAHLYPDLTPMLNHTEAHMRLKIKDGRLENFAPMQAMSDFMGDKNLNSIRFGEMENTFDFKDGTLDVPKMKIASTLGYIFLSGQQDMEERINYEVQVPLSLVQSAGWSMLRNKVAGGNRKANAEDLAETDEEIISEQSGLIRRYMTFNITGTTEEFEVGMGKKKKELP
ncbi:MAG: AsmA-like C-terminal region-containing protein, partial [Flavobacteriales bacterium]|nr:AsmA-like C-terminal region-containing protein [Flavobacteriales bacterium]